MFVDTALGMLGGGGELIVQLAAALGAEAPALRDELQAAAGEALEALKRFGTALRDEIEPSADPHAFAIGEEQFSRRLHHEHALVAGAPELWRYGLHLQEETEARARRAARRSSAGGPGASWSDELRNDAPAPDEHAARRTGRSWSGPAAFVAERGPGHHSATSRWRWCRRPPSSRRWCPSPPTSRRRSFCGTQTGRFYVTRPTRRSRPRRCSPAAPGPLPPRHSGHGGARGVSRATTSSWSRAQGLPSEVRRHLWTPVMVEGWALYCEQLMEEAGYLPRPPRRASSGWSICSGARCGSCSTSACTPAA